MKFFANKKSLASGKWQIILGVFSSTVVGLNAVDFFELGPIHYSDSQPENLVTDLANKKFKPTDETWNNLDFLNSLLTELKVPVESQTLVFSKTSLQKKAIFLNNPRALYFSDSTYVGYVPGGDAEVITHDPKLGLVFYVINLNEAKPGNEVKNPAFGYNFTRRSDCLSCHVSSVTKDVPGLFTRSVVTDDQGEVDFSHENFFVDDQTPLKQRWGGWYVTGNWGEISHMGNDIAGKSKLSKLDNLKGKIDTSKYLKDTSDIVALMVLEHQCKIHTLFVEAKMQYERAVHLENAIKQAGSYDGKNTGSSRLAGLLTENLVSALLFCDEAKINEDSIAGDPEFETAFIAKAKMTKSGKHLRKFRLYDRLFKYRCSYMIHSAAFLALPDEIQKLTFNRIHTILTAKSPPKGYEHLKSREKQTILEILMETTKMAEFLATKRNKKNKN